ncbi:hypothetical protein IW262DRAFT_1482428 [Armillaria fumosa]|nr:hypothetical protein IW262DRAFT_1482428 [Armillaria fumosa]
MPSLSLPGIQIINVLRKRMTEVERESRSLQRAVLRVRPANFVTVVVVVVLPAQGPNKEWPERLCEVHKTQGHDEERGRQQQEWTPSQRRSGGRSGPPTKYHRKKRETRQDSVAAP